MFIVFFFFPPKTGPAAPLHSPFLGVWIYVCVEWGGVVMMFVKEDFKELNVNHLQCRTNVWKD